MSVIQTAVISGVAQSDAAARAFWAVVAGGIELVAMVRVVRLPAPMWAYGRWSKTAAVIIAGWFTLTLGVLAVPVGAVAVIWHTRTLALKAKNERPPTELPFAEGVNEKEGDRS